MIALAISAAVAVQPALPVVADPASAEITRLEQQWGEAFVKRDFEFIEAIVAPEFRLVRAGNDGTHGITLREEWMTNSRNFNHHAFAVETVDVHRAGDTAVASAKGSWTVTMRPGAAPRSTRFFVTDTWLRRGGRWQVIHRYSHRLDYPPPAPPATTSGAPN